MNSIEKKNLQEKIKTKFLQIDFSKLFLMDFNDKIERKNFNMTDDEFQQHIRNLYIEYNFHKYCTKCKENKRFSEYHFNFRNKNYLEFRCKKCIKNKKT